MNLEYLISVIILSSFLLLKRPGRSLISATFSSKPKKQNKVNGIALHKEQLTVCVPLHLSLAFNYCKCFYTLLNPQNSARQAVRVSMYLTEEETGESENAKSGG